MPVLLGDPGVSEEVLVPEGDPGVSGEAPVPEGDGGASARVKAGAVADDKSSINCTLREAHELFHF